MAKPELKKKWWVGIRPKTVKGVELERALGLVEAERGDKLVAALAALAPAIAKARAELKGQKDLLKEIDALEALAEGESKRLVAELAKAKAASAKAAEQAAEKAAGKEEPEGEEPAEDKLFDVALHRSTLRRAMRQPLVFAFSVGSQPQNRTLALAVRGNPQKFGRLAKQEGGGARACFGTLVAAKGEAGKLILHLESPLVPGTAKALRLYFKENKLTSLFRKFAVHVDGQEAESHGGDDDEDGEAPAVADAAAPAASAEASAPEARAATAGASQTAETAARQAPPASPEERAATAPPLEVLEDRRREFKKARAAWVAVKARAEEDLEKVKDGAHMAYMADAGQFPKIVAGCKAIDEILDHLDDELRDTLDRYASTPLRDQKRLAELAATASEVLERYQRFVAGNALMRAIDEKEFADVSVHAPVTKALADLRKALA